MSRRKHFTFSAEFKIELVLSVLTGEKSQAEVCQEHHLSAQQFGNWKLQKKPRASYTRPPAKTGNCDEFTIRLPSH